MHQKLLFLVWGTVLLIGVVLLVNVMEPIRSFLLRWNSDHPSCQTPGNIDYSELCDLLKAQRFEEANFVTERLLLQLVKLNPEDYLAGQDIKILPCEEFKTINQLWLQYSNYQFGFSVQREIWLALGNRLDVENPVEYDRFTQAVGWMDGSRTRLLTEEDFGFQLNQSKGHLPILPKAATRYPAAHLVSRAKVCSM